ncbi:hypothetical protein OYC64_021284 [Pagothenia borchgrevinki]|uniref:Myb/SANT-like DNA-binding domain-containing protein n=1 Tax=Pagothenia borchgrevinki TaxID=8213 RepID=A0ABD2FZJ2_PAGBO
MAKKSTPWSIDEVTTFLHLIADDKIQRELDGATRNLNVFQEVSALLSERGFSRTFQQCREKLKKLKGPDTPSSHQRTRRRRLLRRRVLLRLGHVSHWNTPQRLQPSTYELRMREWQ